MSPAKPTWYESDETENEAFSFVEYDMAAAPNDFNLKTIFDFIESSAVQIPPFQRNYVWDIKRASRLIESLVMGIPVPQVFLYELEKNKFSVIDGQQRLLTIYYFMKGRFPVLKKRSQLRAAILDGGSPAQSDEMLDNDDFFEPFELTLVTPTKQQHPLQGLSYLSLGEYKSSFDLRTIRNIIVKQISPKDDHSAMIEVFSRLNSGGINLSAQELRASLFPSEFLKLLAKLNIDPRWRSLIKQDEPDDRMKDVEFLLRGLAIAIGGDKYKGPMSIFLNKFLGSMKNVADVGFIEKFFNSFLSVAINAGDDPFIGQKGRFNISIFESVLYAVGSRALSRKATKSAHFTAADLKKLKNNKKFIDATASRTADPKNIKTRLDVARTILAAK